MALYELVPIYSVSAFAILVFNLKTINKTKQNKANIQLQ